MGKKSFFILFLVVILITGFTHTVFADPYLCGDNGYTFSDESFCNTACSHTCQELQLTTNGSVGSCDSSTYEGFVYDSNTQHTYAATKSTSFWDNYRNQLVIIKDADTNQLLASMLNYYSINEAWTGAYDPNMSTANSGDPSRFVWRDNSTLTYSNWHSGEPDNLINNQDIGAVPYLGEHWVTMYNDGSCNDNGYHYNYSSDNNYAPQLNSLVQWYGKLSCVDGVSVDNVSDSEIEDNVTSQYCDGISPCYMCADSSECANSCPSGYTYNTTNNDCEATATCPSGGSIQDNICVVSVSYQCPSGYTYNSQIGDCEAQGTITCPNGGSYDSTLNECVENSTNGVCPADTTPVDDVCVYNSTHACPSGGSLNADTCSAQVVKKCPSEYTFSENKCVANAICPSDDYTGISNGLCITDTQSCSATSSNFTQCYQASSGYLCPLNMQKCTASYSNSTCPTGGTLNDTLHKCTAQPNITCPSGYTYDQSIERCVASAQCDNNGSLNPNTDLCEVVVSSSLCPSGYTFNSTYNACVKTPTCPNGGSYNPNRDRCEYEVNKSCPSDYALNTDKTMCLSNPQCPSGSSYNSSTNKCQMSITETCPSGYTQSGSMCYKSPQCPSGYTYNTTHNDYEKLANASAYCPSGGHLNTSMDKCVASVIHSCVSGYYYTSGQCLSSPHCPSGTSYNARYNKCLKSANLSCPSGYYRSGNICYRSPACPSGSYYNARTNRCERAKIGGVCSAQGTQLKCKTKSFRCAPGAAACCHIDIICNSNSSGTIKFYGCCGTHVFTTATTSQLLRGKKIDCAGSNIKCSSNGSCKFNFYNYYCSRPCSGWYKSTRSFTLDSMATYACSFGGRYNSLSSCRANCKTCPSGWSRSGSICYRSAYCPSGGHLNTSRDKCQKSVTISCPSGTSYDSSIHYCVKSASCPSGGSLNTSTDKCQSNVITRCPSGYYRSGNQCLATPRCSYGYSYNTSTNTCQKNATTSASCSYGGTLNTSLDKCQLNITKSCSSGFTMSGSYCVANASCIGSGTLNTSIDKCVIGVINTCASSYTYDSSTDICYSSPVCNYGYYDNSINQCRLSAATTCPSDYPYNSTTKKCEKSPVCSSPGSYSTSLNKCGYDAGYNCATDYIYNATDKLCETTPQCDNGTFQDGNNKCYDGDFTCPLGNYQCVHYNDGNYCSSYTCVNVDNLTDGQVQIDDNTTNNDKQADGNVSDSGCSGSIYIFNGGSMSCRKAGIETGGTNCCQKKKDWIGLGRCKPDEVQLAQKRANGFCHYVGSYCSVKVLKVCLQKKAVYCCFHSTLGRIVQEQSRATQGLPYNGWGKAKSPICWGFTPNQFQELDWSKIDLSEYYDYIQSKFLPAAKQKANDSINNAVQKMQTEIQ